ncbi:helix-turn-helix transcriptional regulator [Actinoallomurus sp. NPDC052308]|uniref:helix-turn-helix domain-containing protein n=1 Tax=Actinoallomurus sp. NPDC052308 TaxID=3155530 RepID=UPI00344436B2
MAERRKPLQPLPAELPEPVRRFTEEIRLLYERVGSTLARLGKDLNVSDSSLSRYLNAQTPIPADVLDRLCELAGASADERTRLEDLRAAALAARAAGAGDRDSDSPTSADVDRRSLEAGTAEGESAPAGPVRRGRGRLLAVVALTAVVAGAAAVAVIMAVTGDDRPSATHSAARPGGCRQRPQYRVVQRGNVVDAHGVVVGTVWPGDLFTRDDGPGNPDRPYRYYGVVTKNGLAGYVLEERLDYYRAVCG